MRGADVGQEKGNNNTTALTLSQERGADRSDIIQARQASRRHSACKTSSRAGRVIRQITRTHTNTRTLVFPEGDRRGPNPEPQQRDGARRRHRGQELLTHARATPHLLRV